MKETIDSIRREIRDTEDTLCFINLYQLKFSQGGYNLLVDQIQTLKIRLALMEAQQYVENRKLIMMN